MKNANNDWDLDQGLSKQKAEMLSFYNRSC